MIVRLYMLRCREALLGRDVCLGTLGEPIRHATNDAVAGDGLKGPGQLSRGREIRQKPGALEPRLMMHSIVQSEP